MILATMILMLAALAIIVIGFVMDRLAIRKIKSGMRLLNKKIKALQGKQVLELDAGAVAKAAPGKAEEGDDDQEMDSEPKKEDGSASPAEDNG